MQFCQICLFAAHFGIALESWYSRLVGTKMNVKDCSFSVQTMRRELWLPRQIPPPPTRLVPYPLNQICRWQPLLPKVAYNNSCYYVKFSLPLFFLDTFCAQSSFFRVFSLCDSSKKSFYINRVFIKSKQARNFCLGYFHKKMKPKATFEICTSLLGCLSTYFP